MFCPKCKAEYEPWISACTECHLTLVPDPALVLRSDSNVETSQKWVTLAAFSHAIDAHVARTKLESEGIHCFIADEYVVTMNWLYSNLVGGVKLRVMEGDIEKARQILFEESIETTPIDCDCAEDHARFVCPKCHSENIEYERFSRKFTFASWLIFSFPIPVLSLKWKCKGCGNRWKIQ